MKLIDIGAFNGDSVLHFIAYPDIDSIDAYEPDEPFCLKVDAEGAEYDILERLIESGKSELVDRIYVEWHDNKMSSDNSQRQVDITEHFGRRMKQWL